MDKEQEAIDLIRYGAQLSEQYYQKPIVCTYSGGKDSDVLLELFLRSGADFILQHSLTTVDAPQTMQHVRETFRRVENEGIECEMTKPVYKGQRVSMWSLIPQKSMPPTRIFRYCCSVFKESALKGSVIATGVRWAESIKRSRRTEIEGIKSSATDAIRVDRETMLSNDNDDSRKMIDHCIRKSKTAINPIISWTDADIWDYIRSEHIQVNELYHCGYNRVGCVGCPVAGKHRYKEFADFPGYQGKYIEAFEKMLEERAKKGIVVNWKNGEEVFRWWMEDDNIKGQMELSEYGIE